MLRRAPPVTHFDKQALVERMQLLEARTRRGVIERISSAPAVPESLVMIGEQGERHVHLAPASIWYLPVVLTTLVLAMAVTTESTLTAAVAFGIGGLLALTLHAYRTAASRQLVFDGQRRILFVIRGNETVLEIPFDAVDGIDIEVTPSNPLHEYPHDGHLAVAVVGPAVLPLHGTTNAYDARDTARRVAALTGATLEPDRRGALGPRERPGPRR